MSQEDPWFDALDRHINLPMNRMASFFTFDTLYDAVGVEVRFRESKHARRITTIMSKLGFERVKRNHARGMARKGA
jgi:hypothetical protein